MRGRILGGLAVAAVLPFAASAQVEQTVEGAQAFLELITSQENAQIDERIDDEQKLRPHYRPSRLDYRQAFQDYECQNNGWTETCFRVVSIPAGKLKSISAPRRCRLAIKHDAPTPDLNRRWSLHEQNFHTDWHRVSDIRADGPLVYFKPSIPGLTADMRITFSSPSTAARVAYAMEFLRVHCDPTAATGF